MKAQMNSGSFFPKRSTLRGKSAVLSSKSPNYTEEELQEYRQVFSMFDTDGSGAIGREELKIAMGKLGLTTKPDELENLIAEVDQDGNGEIDFGEFCNVMRKITAKKVTFDEVVKQCFEVFDQQKNGVITEAEFREVMKMLGDIGNDRIIDHIFQEIDIDGNGVIDYEEFSSIVKQYLQEEV
ncbi:unnamed protein product [Soboliphyme baturini]|uniref:Calmodulin n=1 Tax=Soboliphyme baturini TaxID=241478 RepID=A0A183IY37_9BILA|nr:unnamed protein product [Soboliphyme baturini]